MYLINTCMLQLSTPNPQPCTGLPGQCPATELSGTSLTENAMELKSLTQRSKYPRNGYSTEQHPKLEECLCTQPQFAQVYSSLWQKLSFLYIYIYQRATSEAGVVAVHAEESTISKSSHLETVYPSLQWPDLWSVQSLNYQCFKALGHCIRWETGEENSVSFLQCSACLQQCKLKRDCSFHVGDKWRGYLMM